MIIEANYHAVRRAIQEMPQFNWLCPNQLEPNDPGCIACACRNVEGVTEQLWDNLKPIIRVLGVTDQEAQYLWIPNEGSLWIKRHAAPEFPNTKEGAIAKLDLVASWYGLTPPTDEVAPPTDAELDAAARAWVDALKAELSAEVAAAPCL